MSLSLCSFGLLNDTRSISWDFHLIFMIFLFGFVRLSRRGVVHVCFYVHNFGLCFLLWDLKAFERGLF